MSRRAKIGSVLVGVAVLALGTAGWMYFIGGPDAVAENDPQPPVDRIELEPEATRDQVATDLVGRPIYTYAVHALAFSPDSKRLAIGGGDGGVQLIELEDRAVSGWPAHDSWTFSIVFYDNTTLYTGGGDNQIKQWGLGDHRFDDAGTVIGQLDNDVHGIAVSNDGATLYATGDDRSLAAWDIATGKQAYRVITHDEQVPALKLSPDGKLVATGSRDDKVRLISAGTGQVVRTIDAHRNDVLDLAFSPDGKTVASASYDTTVQVHAVDDGQRLAVLNQSKDRVFAVAFSPDGRLLATGGEDAKLRLYAPGATYLFEDTHDLAGRLADISRLAFSPDGSLLAVASSSGDVLLISTETWAVTGAVRYEVAGPAPVPEPRSQSQPLP